MHALYLHGFASSPESTKALFFAERLARHGVPLSVPDLNLPQFETITTTRMVTQVRGAIADLPPGPVLLIGSSLGAFVAWHVAAREEAAGRPVARLVLLAPALDFGSPERTGLSAAEFAAWEQTGWHRFHHYAYDAPRQVHFELHADAQYYDSWTTPVSAPGIVFMGRRDAVVAPSMVEAFCATRPNLELCWLDDEHQLGASLDLIWEGTARFLALE